MTLTHRDAQGIIRTARSEDAGKPLQNNTRLFRREGGAFAVKLHAVDVVTINPDGTYTLRAGGWHTVTTLDRIRAYAPVSWDKLFSVKGDWYMRLEPSPKDPRPARYDRTVPKPYEASDPGPEPIKSDEGCVAGQFVTTEHVNEVVETYRRNMQDGDELVEVTHESSVGNGDYDDVKVRRSWNSHVYIGEAADQWGYDEGWANLPDNHNGHGRKFTNDDGETVSYVQCSHCKEFDTEHERWHNQMHGAYWGRRFDQQTGYAKYAEMMAQFGSVEAWQEAYIADFRARRAYLKADRKWDERNRVPFYDGITVNDDGYAPRLRKDGPSPAKLRRHEKEVKRIKKAIDKYVAGFIAELSKGTMPMPSGGDCWHCCMFDAVPANDGGRLAKRGVTVEPGDDSNNEHLFEHMRERYYVPSLAVNALRYRGYKDVGIYMWLDMDNDAGTMGKENGRYDNVKRDLVNYLNKRLVPNAPTE